MAFTLWPDFILLVSALIAASVAGFVIYGSIVGFENTLNDFDENPSDAPEKPTLKIGKENTDEK